MMKRMERLKLYPTKRQALRLQLCLDVCRQLYNLALEQRRNAWRERRLSITRGMQYAQLTELRAADNRMAAVYRELQDSALRKLDLAFTAFFRRVRTGHTPGFPRFRAAARYNTLEFPHGNRALRFSRRQDKIVIPGLGSVRILKGREVPVFGRAMIVRSPRGWYALFECKREAKPLTPTGRKIGIDVGVATLYATSDGEFAAHAALGKRKAALLARAQRQVARRQRGGSGRRQAVKLLARAYDALRWSRRDWHHKLVNMLVRSCDSIVLEKLQVRNMTRSARGSVEEPGRNVAAKAALNRKILDAGWSQFANMLLAKAEEAGRAVVFVQAQYSSQTCAACSYVAPKNRRSQAVFVCGRCEHSDHADVNAAKIILKRAELLPAGSGAEQSDCEDPRSELSRARTPVAQHVA
jgi:putative transposase